VVVKVSMSGRDEWRSVGVLVVIFPILLGCGAVCSGPFGLESQAGSGASSTTMCSPPPSAATLVPSRVDFVVPYEPVRVSAFDRRGATLVVSWSWLGPNGVVALSGPHGASVTLTALNVGAGRLLATSADGGLAEIDVTVR
jgi:hypothetical protein